MNILKKNRHGFTGRAGLPPGTLLDSETPQEKPSAEWFIFNSKQIEHQSFSEGTDSRQWLNHQTEIPAESRVRWLNINGVHDAQAIRAAASVTDLHHLLQEDIQNTSARPKLEFDNKTLFLSCGMLQWNESEGSINREHLAFILNNDLLISLQQRPGDVFKPVRDRIQLGRGRIRNGDVGYLLFSLLDAVLDNYFLIMERIEQRIEEVEHKVFSDNRSQDGNEALVSIQELKNELIQVKHEIWPLREMFHEILRGETPFIDETLEPYFRDLYDHCLQMIDMVETFREDLNGIIEISAGLASNSMNQVMKVLTLIATIFIPLTFVAGIYGMNFQNMPELTLAWTYPTVLGGMGGIGLFMIIFFKRKGWL
ncbi:MAG: magnesium/cobalt transporter CorA [Spirochaetales bacterium]|nr:magnesium/cobalt transporter CorA [Spirochaetales bacterium]MCF7938703.1 magnesium/cobalt transporter CorA [Spirochaetales bacterium]